MYTSVSHPSELTGISHTKHNSQSIIFQQVFHCKPPDTSGATV